MDRFIYLKTGLAIVLGLVYIPNWLSLAVIVLILSVTITI